MQSINQIKTIFSFFLKTSLKSRRTKSFFFLSIIPAVIIIIVNIAGNNEVNSNAENLFHKIGILFFFGFFVQVLSLFFGTSIIHDEVNDKTLIYLTTKPISKSSILIGKYFANFIISLLIMIIGLGLAYITTLKGNNFNPIEILSVFGTASITIFSYMAFFTLLGTVLKRPIMIGLIYCFGWEPMSILIGGTLQNFSFTFYINKLLPTKIFEYRSFPSSVPMSLMILIFSAVILIGVASFVFKKKEYNMSDAS